MTLPQEIHWNIDSTRTKTSIDKPEREIDREKKRERKEGRIWRKRERETMLES